MGNPLETTGEQEQFGSSPAMKVCHVLRSPGSTLICLPVAILVSKQYMCLGCRTKRWTSLSLCHSWKSFWHIVAVVYSMYTWWKSFDVYQPVSEQCFLRRAPADCGKFRPRCQGAESLPQGRPQRSNGATTWCRVPNAVVLAECMHSTFLRKNPCSAGDNLNKANINVINIMLIWTPLLLQTLILRRVPHIFCDSKRPVISDCGWLYLAQPMVRFFVINMFRQLLS